MPEVTFTTRGALGKSALRQANERLILNELRGRPAISRADLVRITGLSPSSVTFIVNRLMREGLLEEIRNDSIHAQVGRQPTPLRLTPDARFVVAVSIRRAAAQVTLSDWTGHIVRSKKVSGSTDAAIFLGSIRTTVSSLLDQVAPERVLGVGVAVPGTPDRRTGRVSAENLGWIDIDVTRELQRSFAAPVYIENESRLSALSELWASGTDLHWRQDFVFITAGEGIGTGVVSGGRLLRGFSGAAGEFGHVVLHPGGLPCPCGNRGCWEQYASAAALTRCYGENVEAEEIIRRARHGESQALAAVSVIADALAQGFGNLLFALNPAAIILGDYIADAWDLLEALIWESLRSRLPPYYLASLRIVPSRHSSDAALEGAKALVLSHYFTTFTDQPSAAGTLTASF